MVSISIYRHHCIPHSTKKNGETIICFFDLDSGFFKWFKMTDETLFKMSKLG